VALLVAAALVLPVAIGTGVVVYRAFHDDDEASDRVLVERPVIPPFGAIAFRVGADDTRYCALLADTDDAQQLGMQNRSDLGGYDAMVFAFAADTTVAFTNHYVPIDLSIGWYDSAGQLIEHTTMEKCPSGENCPLYSAKDPFRYAIETPAGGLSALGLASSGSVVHVGGQCS
jgi:uncharacterized membrane protein (UPF0127 family)